MRGRGRGKSEMKKLFWKERAQVVPIIALLAVVFVGLLGLAIDMARLFVARTELSRALDSAALAGVVELPDVDNAHAKATTYLGANLPDASASFPATGDQFQIRVKGTRDIDMLFMDIFGFSEVEVSATATAGFGVVPLDVVMAIDATGSMGANPPCNAGQSNSGCPIKEAKDAAKGFADLLLSSVGSSETLVGVTAFRGCFNPPRLNAICIPGSWVTNLSSNEAGVISKITSYSALGGSGTNVCLGLNKSNQILFGVGNHDDANTLRFIVILSDGDNTYNNVSWGNGEPPVVCRPTTTPANSDGDVSSSCLAAQTRERQLDTKTRQLADTIKALDVEIYVVGFGVCGSSNTNLCNTGLIGGTSHDNTADRNLNKCIASSTPGTNDHYFEAATAGALPNIFQVIAQNIAFRLIE